MSRFVGLLGIFLIIGVGVLLSSNRRAIRWQVIAWGLGLQVFFAVFVLQVPAGQELFRALGAAVTALLDRLLHHAHVLKCGPRSWRTKVHTDLRPEDGTK